MNVEIITIGDELLIGQVTDTNSAWLATQLNNIGLKVVRITTISDTKQAILDSIKMAASHADIILITGGLGPTKDDITKQTLCEYFETQLELNKHALDNIIKIFASRGFEVTDINRKQAEVPQKCTCIENIYGRESK